MKRSTVLAAVSALFLLTASCSKDEATSNAQGSGGSGGATTGAGGSGGVSDSGGTTGSGGSADSGGSGGSADSGGSGGSSNSDGSGGSSTTTARDASAAGGTSGSGGTSGGATTRPRRDAGSAGGSPGTGGAPARGGSGGAAPATGGTTGTAVAGTGGRTGAGGATPTGGSTAGDGGSTGGGVSDPAPSAGCGKATTLTSARASIDVNGKTREYILALPNNYDENHPYKLIFGWHPWGGSAQQVSSGGYFGLQRQANNEAIFVAGEGQDYQDRGLGWGNAGGEDFDFYQAMLERFRSQLCVDENRIFATGFSFGAMFSFSLGCEADSMLRAIMPMAGNTTTSGGCATGTRSVAVMSFIGVDDSLLSGHRQAVQTYAKRDGCTTDKSPMDPSWCDGLADNNLPCTCVSYQGCKDGYPVVECEYKAGHQQAPNPGPIWEFLAQF